MVSNMRTLVKKFEILGVDDPESWASSQVKEGIDQVSRATVLSALVDAVISSCAKGKKPEFLRGSAAGTATWEKLLTAGIEPSVLKDFCSLAFASGIEQALIRLSGAMELSPNPDGMEVVVVKFDSETRDVVPLDDLHESFWQLLTFKLGREI